MYRIIGKSKYGTEEIDTADSKGEAEYLVMEYVRAFGSGWIVWFKHI